MSSRRRRQGTRTRPAAPQHPPRPIGIAGDFAEWRAGKVKLEKREGGNWYLKTSLPRGRYQ